MFKTAAAIVAISLLAGIAHADPSDVTVYNTGLGVGGAALAAGNGQADANYAIIASDFAVSGQAQTYFNNAYYVENLDSRWVSYAGAPFLGLGSTTFETTFDLTGFDPLSAIMTGLWGVDNEGEVYLNGNLLASLNGIVYENFNALSAFGASTGFVSGINKITFVIHDAGSPLAFRTDQMSVTADAVPEPAAWALMILGFGLAGTSLRRRKTLAA